MLTDVVEEAVASSQILSVAKGCVAIVSDISELAGGRCLRKASSVKMRTGLGAAFFLVSLISVLTITADVPVFSGMQVSISGFS